MPCSPTTQEIRTSRFRKYLLPRMALLCKLLLTRLETDMSTNVLGFGQGPPYLEVPFRPPSQRRIRNVGMEECQ